MYSVLLHNKRPNEHLIQDDDDTIRFISSWDNLYAIQEAGHDLADLFAQLSGGALPAKGILDTLICCINDIDGEEVKEAQKESVCKCIIEQYGLQEASIVARMMLTATLIGAKKNYQIQQGQLIRSFIPSQSMSLRKAGLLWVATSLISAVVVCLIFKYSGMLTF